MTILYIVTLRPSRLSELQTQSTWRMKCPPFQRTSSGLHHFLLRCNRYNAAFSRRVPRTLLVSALQRLTSWHQKRESRRVLRDLTDAELLDIGVTRAEANKEASKSFFWD